MNKKNNTIAILGIHTGIGKTIVSAVLTETLQAHYWKPVQAGIEDRDMVTVQSLITDGAARVHPEAVLLRTPASPHTAAAIAPP
jgi:dethiobiotin synthetase